MIGTEELLRNIMQDKMKIPAKEDVESFRFECVH